MKSERRLVKKISGGDYELGAFIEGAASGRGDAPRAARLLLSKLKGIPALRADLRRVPPVGDDGPPLANGYYHPLDWGRIFFPKNAASAYVDCDHPEIAIGETFGARQHCAAMRGMFLTVREAMDRVNAEDLPPGQRLRVLLNNSDGSRSFGTHQNYCTAREAFHQTMKSGPRSRHLQFLASWNAVSMILGQGKVGGENGSPAVDFQFSQRADYISELISENTQFPPGRPLVNSRDEAHTGPATGLARVHDIVHDNHMCQTGAVLTVGLTEIILCMIELDAMPPRLLLDDPVTAAVRISHDFHFAGNQPCGDRRMSALDLFEDFVAAAHAFAADGKLEGIVNEWPLILGLAAEVASDLRQDRREALARKLDAFAKHQLLSNAIDAHGLHWGSPAVKMLDHLYSSLDDGLFWELERRGQVDRLVSDQEILALRDHGSPDTRASLRAHMLRIIPPDSVLQVDWSQIRVEAPDAHGKMKCFVIHLPDPAAVLVPDSALGRATNLAELLAVLFPEPAAPMQRSLTKDLAAS